MLATFAYLKREWDGYRSRRRVPEEVRDKELEREFQAGESVRRGRLYRRAGLSRLKRRQRHMTYR
jgi:hypothetical protein